ncbi:MAG: glycosyltransferase family 2 protein [Bacteroidia bacterium]
MQTSPKTLPTVSLITVTYNAAQNLHSCIGSVRAQDYPHIEHIVIDGASTDGTQDIVRSYGDAIAHFVSEPDAGLYDAMNKGLARATGDIVGILNADDMYAHAGVISAVVDAMQRSGADTLFADLVYVSDERPGEIVRYFPGRGFRPTMMRRGFMPPHPTYFVRRALYARYGGFDTQFRICADFDLMVRHFVVQGVRYHYLPQVIVHMRTGGSSTQGLRSTRTINREMLRSLRQHGVRTHMLLIYSKYINKIFQLIRKPR